MYLEFNFGHLKYSIKTSFFAVNLTLKLFRVTVADADIGNLKSLHTFLSKYLYHMLVKFESFWTKSYGPNYTPNFERFDNKKQPNKQNRTSFCLFVCLFVCFLVFCFVLFFVSFLTFLIKRWERGVLFIYFFFQVQQSNDSKVWIRGVPSLITIVWHVKPGEKLHQTWQIWLVLKKTDPCLN